MSPFNEIGFSDLLDIACMTFLIYTVLVWFKKTRAALVLIGLLIIAGIYLLARQFNLFLTASVFQAFFAVILVALVVIFQEELRHFFERVAILGLKTPFGKRKAPRLSQSEVAILVRSLADFAKERIGALVVLKGKDMILRHLEGGEELHGALSEALLKSLLDPHSPGHDGAIIAEGNLVTRFGCHLPLSKNFKLLGDRGTRHAAALGLSELSDALCLVVSEEKGTIAYMRFGEMYSIADSQRLNMVLENFYREVNPPKEPRSLKGIFRKNFKEKGIALTLASFLWFLHVYGSKVVYRTFPVPVAFTEVPKQFLITEMEPGEVAVTFSGPRRSFYFLSKKKMTLFLKMWQIKEGDNTLRVSASDLMVPENFTIVNISPRKITLHAERK